MSETPTGVSADAVERAAVAELMQKAGKAPIENSPADVAPPTPADDSAEQPARRTASKKAGKGTERPQLQRASLPSEAPRRQRPAPAAQDPEFAVAKLAKRMQAEETLEQMQRLEASRTGRDQFGRRIDSPAPIRTQRRQRRQKPDVTRPVDSQGNEMDLGGKVLRWVRTVDGRDRPDAAHVGDFVSYGFEPVLDPHTGEEITSYLGKLFMADPMDAAERVLDATPEGALNRDALLADTMQAVKELNRAGGGDVCHLTVDNAHGVKRRYEGQGAERQFAREAMADDNPLYDGMDADQD